MPQNHWLNDNTWLKNESADNQHQGLFGLLPDVPRLGWTEPVAIPAMPGSVRELAGICVGFPSESITVTKPPITIHEF